MLEIIVFPFNFCPPSRNTTRLSFCFLSQQLLYLWEIKTRLHSTFYPELINTKNHRSVYTHTHIRTQTHPHTHTKVIWRFGPFINRRHSDTPLQLVLSLIAIVVFSKVAIGESVYIIGNNSHRVINSKYIRNEPLFEQTLDNESDIDKFRFSFYESPQMNRSRLEYLSSRDT